MYGECSCSTTLVDNLEYAADVLENVYKVETMYIYIRTACRVLVPTLSLSVQIALTLYFMAYIYGNSVHIPGRP